MTQPRIVGLCSPAMGSGKSTVAAHLVAQHGFVRVAFATPLKMMTEGLYRSLGMTDEEVQRRIYGDLKEAVIPEIGVTSRLIQQTIGTEWGRHCISDTIWVDIAMNVAGRLVAAGTSVVIDDLRFPNEYDAIDAAGGTSYRIVRPDAAVTRIHASEGQLDGIAMPEIWNISTIERLTAEAERIIFA